MTTSHTCAYDNGLYQASGLEEERWMRENWIVPSYYVVSKLSEMWVETCNPGNLCVVYVCVCVCPFQRLADNSPNPDPTVLRP